MAGCTVAANEIATLLHHWRMAGKKIARAKGLLALACGLFIAGIGIFAYVLFGLDAVSGAVPAFSAGGVRIPAIWIGPTVMALAGVAGFIGLLHRTWNLELPGERPPLSREERSYIGTAEVKQAIRAALQPGFGAGGR